MTTTTESELDAQEQGSFFKLQKCFQRAAIVLLEAKLAGEAAVAQRSIDLAKVLKRIDAHTETDCAAMDAYFGPGKEARQDADRLRTGMLDQINDKTGAYQ